MIASVDERDANIHHRIPSEHSAVHRFFYALCHRADVFTRNNTADNFVFELKTLARFVGFEFQPDMAILVQSLP